MMHRVNGIVLFGRVFSSYRKCCGCRHDISDLERQLSEQVKSVDQLQSLVTELSAKVLHRLL